MHFVHLVSFDPRFISSAKVEHDKKTDSMLTQFLRYKNRFDSESQVDKHDEKEENIRKYVTVYDTLPMLSFRLAVNRSSAPLNSYNL